MESVPTNYPGGLTDSQWGQTKGSFPQGPNSAHHKRGLINAVPYLADNGCKWRAIPMISHLILPCTPFTAGRGSTAFGKRFLLLWQSIHGRRPDANPGRLIPWLAHRAWKPHRPVKTVGLTGEKRRAGNAISWQMRWAIRCPLRFTLPISMTQIGRFCAGAGYRKSFEEAIWDELERVE